MRRHFSALLFLAAIGFSFLFTRCNASSSKPTSQATTAVSEHTTTSSTAQQTPADATTPPADADQQIPIHIIAHMKGGRGINVVFDQLQSTTFQPIMEAVADSNGVIDIQTTIPAPGPYQLRFPHGTMHLILKGGTLHIQGSIDRLSNFDVEGDGAEETRALYHLYHIINQFNHEFRRLQKRSDEAGDTKDAALVKRVIDSIGYVSYGIQYRKNRAMQHFIRTHDTMLVIGIAALRLNLDVFFPDLAYADSLLQSRYPTSHLTRDVHKKYLAAYPYMPGKPAPPFTLPDLTGEKHALSDFKGQYVLLDFWASWCQPCLRSIPHLKRLHQLFAGKGFRIVGISIDDAAEKAEAVVKERQIPWLILWAGDRSQVAVDYQVEGIPHYVVIDPNGRIASMMLRGQALDDFLTERLGQ